MCKYTPCPLQLPTGDSCINLPSEKLVYTLTDNYQMTVVQRSKESYKNNYFPCNNKNCILYEKVCNLVDDCGDASDEVNCTNHFRCDDNKEYVPVSSKCDSYLDCSDYSDECNGDCSNFNTQILANISLKISSWIIGITATMFNIITIYSSFVEKNPISLEGLLNKMLTLLIGCGDMLMGLYLVAISAVDLYFAGDVAHYCKHKYLWLSSPYCAALGVLNTVASQISLLSMTVLSITRVSNLKTMIPTDGTTIKHKVSILFRRPSKEMGFFSTNDE
jgi:hypothetical protein